MVDFTFLENPISHQWIISAPNRSHRPHEANGTAHICPFCPENEGAEQEVFRLGSIRVIPNKFPFAPIHEVIIHSPDHDKNIDTLPLDHAETLLQVYRHRYTEHHGKGQVYIFNNHGQAGGESLPHAHSQLTVIPFSTTLMIPTLNAGNMASQEEFEETDHFWIFCPKDSQWPDEVWVAPKRREQIFGTVADEALKECAFVLQRLIQIFDLRHGHEFPFNFYIYPGVDWYLRLIPRVKTLGGFEVGTGVFVNTQDPDETIQFIQTHFHTPDTERIRREHKATYRKGV